MGLCGVPEEGVTRVRCSGVEWSYDSLYGAVCGADGRRGIACRYRGGLFYMKLECIVAGAIIRADKGESVDANSSIRPCIHIRSYVSTYYCLPAYLTHDKPMVEYLGSKGLGRSAESARSCDASWYRQ